MKGTWFTSTAEPVMLAEARRRPFNSTSVAAEPWPRRLAKESPLLPRRSLETTSEFEERLSDALPLSTRKEISCSGLAIALRSISCVEMI